MVESPTQDWTMLRYRTTSVRGIDSINHTSAQINCESASFGSNSHFNSVVIYYRYELMTQIWREDPKERPTFDQIVEYLAKMTGVQIHQPLEEHEYHSVEGLMEGEEEEEDVGGVNIYTEVESPMYKNFPTRPDVVIPPPVPEEYEVPVKIATSRSMSAQLDGDQELVVPTEYEVPLSSLPRSGGQQEVTTSSSSSSKQQQQLEDSIQGHVYHTLEAPTNK